MIKRLPPRQFNFSQFWFEDFRKARKAPGIAQALRGISDYYREIADFVYEESQEHDPEQAKSEYLLRLHTAEVMCNNLEWLRSEFEGPDLANLALAIAEHVHPEKKWRVVEDEDVREAIVTDDEFSLVFDMQYFDEIDAGASLALVRAPGFTPTEEQIAQAQEIVEDRLAVLDQATERMRADLEAVTTPVTDLFPSRD